MNIRRGAEAVRGVAERIVGVGVRDRAARTGQRPHAVRFKANTIFQAKHKLAELHLLAHSQAAESSLDTPQAAVLY